jgi:cellulose synthase operon protein C
MKDQRSQPACAAYSARPAAALRRRLLAAALALAALPAVACGPDFAHELLQDRHASVFDLVEGTFDYEASRLVAAPAAPLKAQENLWEAPGEARTTQEQKLGEAYAKVESMRLSFNDAEAWAAGAGLSEEVRLYTAGARAFHAGEYEIARQRFDAVLALPAEAQRERGLWARYMRGRIDRSLAGGAAGLGETELQAHAQAAAQAFQAVRAAVAAGAADPLGLAVASFGEEAAVHLARGDTAAAVQLYAQQAAQGSASGRASLLFTARRLFADEATLLEALQDPLLQQLLAAYVYTRSGELQVEDGGEMKTSPLLARYYSAVEAATGNLAGVDRVAAAAYRAGRFELAGKLAARSDAALALWVRAKLALRAGDTPAAAAAYAQASRAFPRGEDWGSNLNEGYSYESLKPACLVDGERAILALGRGDYIEALRLLHSGGQYWNDAAHVAERVLSVDELKAFVDAEVPEPKAAPKPAADEEGWTPPDPALRLRSLLGRRLLRVGRYAEAAAYFPAELRATAASYAQLRLDAPRQGRIERAETLFKAARIARESGMEILATELGPDAATYGGNYEIYTQTELAAQDSKLVGGDELKRVAASAPEPEQRFHYRYVAARLAGEAADLVPARSQAFASLLCSATGWVISRDYAAGRQYYTRYVKQGAYLPWAGGIGSSGFACPAPDFAAAAQRAQLERLRWAKQLARRYAPWAAAGLLAVGAGLFFWLRRRKTRAVSPAARG